jgi:carboxyl-terminal processing protease
MIAALRRTLSFLPAIAILLGAPTPAEAAISEQLTKAESHSLQREGRLVIDMLQNYHYADRGFRQMASAEMIDRFLSELDPERIFFDAAEVEQIHRRFDRTLKPVYLFRGDLQPAFEIFDLFVARANTRFAWVQSVLDRGFDYSLDENWTKVEGTPPAKTQAELDRRWELELKAQILNEMLLGRTPEAASAEVRRRHERSARMIASYDALAVRERFFDAVIRSFDPHSGYFSSDSTREFAMDMEKALVGIGLELRKEGGRCIVSSLQRGGPADLSNQFESGDVIEAVAEGDIGAWVELKPLRLREVAALLRGDAGSKVRIAYRPAGGPERLETVLERNRVELAAGRAHGAVCRLPAGNGGNRRIGWIRLPEFYAAGENSSLSSATHDVRELLAGMQTEPLDGLVLDLRDNPGGALAEAVALSELFVPGGMVMLSRSSGGTVKEHPAKPGLVAYTGPLVLLVSNASASASEVFSGAMRHHRRAVIAGAPATFGKGTMQAYMDLTKLAPTGAREWGTARVTTEKFFQPDGGSVQRTGVAAHVVFPVQRLDAEPNREEDLPGALPAETVTPPGPVAAPAGAAAIVTEELVGQLNAQVKRHGDDLPEWQLQREETALGRAYSERKTFSLNEPARRIEHDADLRGWHDLALRRRRLAGELAYPSEAFDLATVRKLVEAEDKRWHAAAAPVSTRAPFILTGPDGRRRRLDLAAVDFHRYLLDAPQLARQLAAGSEPAWTDAGVATFLREAHLLREKTPENLTRLARETFPTESAAQLHHRLEALFQQLADLDGDWFRGQTGLDVELREALRLAATWADRTPAHPLP